MQGFSIVWETLTLTMREEGPQVSVGIWFENPTPLTIEGMEGIEIYLALEQTKCVQLVIEKVQLSDDLQERSLKLSMNFIAPLIDVTKVFLFLKVGSDCY
jgi:hypothetical protein